MTAIWREASARRSGREGAARHGALGLQHPLGELLGEVEAEDRQQGVRPGERVEVVVGVDAAQVAEGDRHGGVDGVAVEQARRVQEGEDALAALEVVGDPRQLDLVAPAVDELDAPPPADAGEPPPAPAPDLGESRALSAMA